MVTALSVFARLFLWGEVSEHRDTGLVDKLFAQVRRAAKGIQPILVAVDGFAAYPKVIRQHFATVVRNGKVGCPPRIPWTDLHIGPGHQATQGAHSDRHHAPGHLWRPPARR